MASNSKVLLAALTSLDGRLAELQEIMAWSRVEAEQEEAEERASLEATLMRLVRMKATKSCECRSRSSPPEPTHAGRGGATRSASRFVISRPHDPRRRLSSKAQEKASAHV